ncbi:MAG TPA: hypothetical protein DEG92_01005 [Rikenellaceae bacterium]|nr:hypothetical protein [Rikenellaceae bacterium]
MGGDGESTYFRTGQLKNAFPPNYTRLRLRVEDLNVFTLHCHLIDEGDSAGRSETKEDAQARSN